MPEGSSNLPLRGTLMQGKRGLIMGVANNRSIAWGIASACAAQGAELAFTFQGEALEKRVRPLADGVGSTLVLPCDVSDDAAMDETFARIEAAHPGPVVLVTHGHVIQIALSLLRGSGARDIEWFDLPNGGVVTAPALGVQA